MVTAPRIVTVPQTLLRLHSRKLQTDKVAATVYMHHNVQYVYKCGSLHLQCIMKIHKQYDTVSSMIMISGWTLQ